MGRLKTTAKQKKEATKRTTAFIKLARFFNTVAEFTEWASILTGVSKSTVSIWRCTKETGRPIPKKHFEKIMQETKINILFKDSVN